MNFEDVRQMINELKMIVNIALDDAITVPVKNDKACINLHGTNYDYLFDLNRKGHRKPKCTYQLRDANAKSKILFRIDLIGRPHPNPAGNYAYADEILECPHVHLADFPVYGIAVALPLDAPEVHMHLNPSDINNLISCLKVTFERLNVANRTDFKYNLEDDIL
ncbi:DUF6978 family protein [Lactiplantibacillus dongliensis]|uniref:DUF6978 family protein n=1 Tax=Lactiplantibacillus dongliensis TaxID=2559919 RepID=A0ABW1R927_9LACO|nr:hypothetical protein [Lactiplantibacillus dongliensis]